jgi:thioredoxin reductase (NADPH)
LTLDSAGRCEEERMEKVVIVGGGPAGLTAGIYAGRAQLEPLLLVGSVLGGQCILTYQLENYPGFPDSISGQELIELMQRQAERFSTRMLYEEATGVDLSGSPLEVHTLERTYQAQSLIVATGVSSRKLGVPGESEFIGRGVSYCAVCDGFFYRGKRVAVVGGGDAAVKEGLFLTRFAQQVTIIHRRDRLRATQVLQERAFANDKIDFVWDSVVQEIVGNQLVSGVQVRNVKTDAVQTLPVDGVFVYIGSIPNTGFLEGALDLDEQGFIVADERGHTSRPGVFAAGDARRGVLRQVATAVGSGAVAATEAEEHVAELEGRAYPSRTQ